MNNLLSRKLAYSILLTGLCYSYTNLIPVFAAKPPAFPVQDNPVFSTPTPEEQKIAPESKQFIQGVVKMDVPNEAKADAYKIGNIEMEGNQISQNWYIKQQIKSLLDKQGSLLSEKELEKALIQINKTNKFKLKAKVSQAKNKDTVDVHLDVYERNPWQITLTTDNQGRPGVGTYRWSSQIKNENLLGIGDQLSARYVGAAGSNEVTANYEVPFNKYGGTMSGNFEYINRDVDLHLSYPEQPDMLGHTVAWGGRITQPLDPKKMFTADLGVGIRYNTLFRDETRLAYGGLRNLNFGLKFNKADRFGQTTIYNQYVFGHPWGTTTKDFWRTRIQATRTFNLPQNNKIILRSLVNLTTDPLPLANALPIGGEYSVRGYSEGLLVGDRGHMYSFEYYWPIPFLSKISPWAASRLRGVAFSDFGEVWLDKDNPRYKGGTSNKASHTLLMSVGGGLRYQLTQYLQGFVDVGYGMGPRNIATINASPSVRVHFGIRTDLLPQNNYRKRNDKTVLLTQQKWLRHFTYITKPNRAFT